MGLAWGASAQYSASKAWKACSGRQAAKLVLVLIVAVASVGVASVGDNGDDVPSLSLGALILASFAVVAVILASVPSRTISKGTKKRGELDVSVCESAKCAC
jgi:peptidoglycan/LPS O-acetylase OafA/YrhL